MESIIEHTKNNSKLFKELLELESDEENDKDETKLCLISMLPLSDNYITLECGHSFNYDPLFKDVYNHKKVFVRLESNRLQAQELRCPYCRSVQKKLLPAKIGTPLIYGVNSLNSKIETIARRMKHEAMYYYTFNTYTKGMCCHGMNKKTVLKDGFLETTVTCPNTKVMYNNLDGLVYCAQHNNELMHNIFNKEIARLTGLIDKYQTIYDTTKGSTKGSAKKKISAFTMVCNNIQEVKDEKNDKYLEEQSHVSSDKSDGESSSDEWDTLFDSTNKYNQKCRCFAYYTSGVKKGTRCVNAGGFGVGNELYCAKHPYIFETIEEY